MVQFFNVSSERQLIILVGQPGIRTHTCRDQKHYVQEVYALSSELIGRSWGMLCIKVILYTHPNNDANNNIIVDQNSPFNQFS